MAIESTKYDTIKCDIPLCQERLTAPNPDYFWEAGWNAEDIFDKEICLCPFHSKELKEFLFDDAATSSSDSTE